MESALSKASRVSGLEDHLGYWLRYVSNQVSHAFSLKLGARDVTVAEWVMLRELFERDTMAPSALADRLVAKTLITRLPGKQDRRYQDLALSAAGRSLVPELSALADQNDAEFFGHLAREDRATIERIMKDIVRKRGLRAMPVD
jgi:DNA-binding MarR family transcriptional regulator